MKAVQVVGARAHSRITLARSLPAPTAGGSQVLVRVCAAGITADEVTWPELYESASRVPGHEVSGVVAAVGPEYRGPAAVGDAVFAALGFAAGQGAQAEFALVAADDLAAKPATLSHAQAAALPIPALTAWEAVSRHAEVAHGARVLVTGASGAVGAMLVQLASRVRGARVTALAAAGRHAYVGGLGASAVLDYHDAGWPSAVGPVDVVFDTVGGQTLAQSWAAVREGGVLVTVADPPPSWARGGRESEESRRRGDVKKVYFVVTPSGSALAEVAALLDKGDVEPLLVKAFPADDALEAWAYAGQRGREGKAVLVFHEG